MLWGNKVKWDPFHCCMPYWCMKEFANSRWGYVRGTLISSANAVDWLCLLRERQVFKRRTLFSWGCDSFLPPLLHFPESLCILLWVRTWRTDPSVVLVCSWWKCCSCFLEEVVNSCFLAIEAIFTVISWSTGMCERQVIIQLDFNSHIKSGILLCQCLVSDIAFYFQWSSISLWLWGACGILNTSETSHLLLKFYVLQHSWIFFVIFFILFVFPVAK